MNAQQLQRVALADIFMNAKTKSELFDVARMARTIGAHAIELAALALIREGS